MTKENELYGEARANAEARAVYEQLDAEIASLREANEKMRTFLLELRGRLAARDKYYVDKRGVCIECVDEAGTCARHQRIADINALLAPAEQQHKETDEELQAQFDNHPDVIRAAGMHDIVQSHRSRVTVDDVMWVCNQFIESRHSLALARRDAAAAKDHPELDATDGAHPAWWRGYDHAFAVVCQKVHEILDGKDAGHGVNNEPWHSTRRRLLDAAAAKESLAEAERERDSCESLMDQADSAAHKLMDVLAVPKVGGMNWAEAATVELPLMVARVAQLKRDAAAAREALKPFREVIDNYPMAAAYLRRCGLKCSDELPKRFQMKREIIEAAAAAYSKLAPPPPPDAKNEDVR